MMKTAVVRVIRKVRHPLYNRIIQRRSSFKAHDERNEAKVGDLVRIMETRPLSKDKRWRVIEIVRRAGESIALKGEE
jgi:small subunit ribosomal protein S17